MEYQPTRITAPAALPVTREQLKQHLRINPTNTDEDALLDTYLAAVVAHLDGASGWLGRSIVRQTWQQQFDDLSRQLLLKGAPVIGKPVVTYIDPDDIEQTVPEAYYLLLEPRSSRPIVRFIDDYNLPSTRDQRPAVTVEFVTGYVDEDGADTVPSDLLLGILLLASDLYWNREATLEAGVIANPTVRRLLLKYRFIPIA